VKDFIRLLTGSVPPVGTPPPTPSRVRGSAGASSVHLRDCGGGVPNALPPPESTSGTEVGESDTVPCPLLPATKWLPKWLGCEPRLIVLSLDSKNGCMVNRSSNRDSRHAILCLLRATVVGLGQIELRSYKMRTPGWTLLDMKCYEFEFCSTNVD